MPQSYWRVALVCLLLSVAACAPTPPPSSTIKEVRETKAFPKDWLSALEADARGEGISQGTVRKIVPKLRLIPRVIELDGKQPERKLTFDEYIDRVVNQTRIQSGKDHVRNNQELLKKISDQYGVEPEVIVTLWGVETNYGENTGNYLVLDALATLAYEGRREEFFRAELMHAMRIVDQGHIQPGAMDGSWAGAMGQCQFMPSSFNSFAVDYNGDGRRDIWYTQQDVFASIANYLSKSGWEKGLGWGSKVALPATFPLGLGDGKTKKSLAEWEKLGVTVPVEAQLPNDNLYIVMPGDEPANAYIVTENYKTILKWNRSFYFATSVGMISDAIKQ